MLDKEKYGSSSRERSRFFLVSLTPPFAIICLFCIFPVLFILKESFLARTDQNELSISIENFLALFRNKLFLNALLNSILYTIISTFLSLVTGVLLALALNKRGKIFTILKTMVLIPWAIPPVVIAFLYKWFFNDISGGANSLLYFWGFPYEISWLSKPYIANILLYICDYFIRFPFVFLLVISGLQSIPKQLFELAKTDGLSSWQINRKMVFPLLKPSITLAFIVTSMFSFREFSIVYILTGGGPGSSTELLSLFIYKTAFVYQNFKIASSASVFMIVFTLFIIGLPIFAPKIIDSLNLKKKALR